ncbi:ty3-gypsy retrotransposon protein [Cucumis melo var. makuwa]|uniref:Ty3-gypsy retrotransposon protein n=1 Tax=Cucumis melo var. makuwa TaxID=1194695 RepID=A0A5A7SPV2_CUCMM|nr:ty3-gypsy retrotransposon protein [Cucumis melo var. makuwa]
MLGPINLDIAFAFLQARPTMLRGDLLTNRLLRLQQVRSILRLASKPDNLGRKSLKPFTPPPPPVFLFFLPFAHVSTSTPVSDLLSLTSSVVLHRPHERSLLHLTGRTSPTESHPTAAVSDRLLLGSACTASHRPSLPRLYSVGRRISSIDIIEPRAGQPKPRAEPNTFKPNRAPCSPSHLSLPSSTSGHGIKELTFKFSGSAASLFGDSFPFLGVDSIEGHNRVSSKGFPTTGPRIEAGNVVIHRGLHTPMPDVRYSVVMLMGYVVDWNCMSMDLKVLRTRLICASFGSTRLICAPFGSTRLISASLGITRLIGVSFVITRLMCAFYGTARLLCRVRVQRRADRREAGRMREGHMDASGFLYASADGKCRQGGVHVGVAEEAEEGEQDVFNLRCSL